MDYQADFLRSLAGGFNFGQQVKAQQDDNALRKLASQSYGMQPEDRRGHLAKLAGVSPEYAMAQQKQWSADDEHDRDELVRMARFIKAAPQGEQANAYSRILPALRAKGMQAPDWTPETQGEILKTVDALAQAYGPQSSSTNAVQSTKVGDDGYYYTVDRAGKWTNSGVKADPRTQVVEGQGGFFNVDKRNNTASPVNLGGGVPASTGTPGTSFTAEDGSAVPTQRFTAANGSPVQFDAGVPAHLREQILADPNSFASAPDRATANLPPVNRSPATQLRPADKPEDAPPAGFRRTADGNLEFIPGGPADPFVKNEVTGAQRAKLQQTRQKEQQLLRANEAGIDQTIALIDTILKDQGSFGGVTGMGAAGARIPGTKWADIAAALDTLRGRSAFGALQQMRANSPTGGALGSVTERELGLLQNSETQLQNTQSPEALANGLEAYKKVLQETKRRMREGLDEFYQDSGSAPSGSQSGWSIQRVD